MVNLLERRICFLKLITFVLVLLIFLVHASFSQKKSGRNLIKLKENLVTACEANTAILDAAYNFPRNSELIIIIARLGKGEKDDRLNEKRLRNIATYLKGAWNMKASDLLLAKAKKVKKKGRIEIYIDSVLAGLIVASRGDPLRVGRCVLVD